MRVSRQYRDLMARKRAGLIYGIQDNREAGDLALFCPTCPQPGINVPLPGSADADEEEQ
jgi:hypothetical protein